jgi:DNA-binding HxlR family transcriptional regulator
VTHIRDKLAAVAPVAYLCSFGVRPSHMITESLGGHIMVQQLSRGDNEIEEIQIVLKQVMDELKHQRRKDILKLLPPGEPKTFEELKAETGISTGSLHHHLSELCGAGLVRKEPGSWPHRYMQSPFLKRLMDLVENNQAR